MKFTTAATTIALTATIANATLPPIEVKNNKFFQKGSDKPFLIRGVDYQPGGSSKFVDPIASTKNCERDVKHFKDLGLNTVRVYSVDNSKNHDKCMKMLDDAGIYLILDVNTPKNSINRAEPGPSYNSAYMQTVFATIDAFKGYDNVLGFFAANEVINSGNTTEAAPYVKAVVRDMKQYIKKQSKRTIPVGYSAADVSDNRWEQMQYFNCGDDEDARIDMFGMNDYSWCGDSSFKASGYSSKVEQYKDYSIPLFLSEFGCNEVTPRTFSEIETIYSDDFDLFSGGLVYEYSEESNKYGLVKIDSDDKVSTLKDFDTLKKELKKVEDYTGKSNTGGSKKSSCPKYKKGKWEVKDNDVPKQPSKVKGYIKNGAGKALGEDDAPWTQNGYDEDKAPDSGKSSSTSSDSDSDSDSSSSSSDSKSTESKSPANAVEVPKLNSLAIVPAVALIGSFILGASLF